ncbi:Endoribonuclease L-PSP/chorismate mutase-like protein [Podospora conica]|nr:Endoribonuclease L-PSP/chorismate mutase-like protein [Schizothecium conicum]
MSNPTTTNNTKKTLITTSSPFEPQIGYSRAVISGDLIFVSGCTGYDPKTHTLPPTILAQTAQALANVRTALRAASADFCDVVRVRYILPDRGDFGEPVWALLREAFGEARPAATMVVAGLMEVGMLIEVEVTAVRPGGGRGGVERVLL